jgi:hypothetical protein
LLVLFSSLFCLLFFTSLHPPHFIMGCFPISLFHYCLFHCTYVSMFPHHHFKYLFSLSLLFCSSTLNYLLCPNYYFPLPYLLCKCWSLSSRI